MRWVEYNYLDNPLPPERKYVLLQLEEAGPYPPAVVVGYLRYAAGCKDSPQWITPGVGCDYDRTVSHWCDCLGEDFSAPLWRHEVRVRLTHDPADPEVLGIALDDSTRRP